jgi:flagellar basal body-associated protein FliL
MTMWIIILVIVVVVIVALVLVLMSGSGKSTPGYEQGYGAQGYGMQPMYGSTYPMYR